MESDKTDSVGWIACDYLFLAHVEDESYWYDQLVGGGGGVGGGVPSVLRFLIKSSFL